MRRSRGSLRWLMGLIATSALFVGGCSSGGSTTATSTNLEIFTYWTAGGEADGLAAIESIFNKNYPWFIASTIDGGCVESVAKYDVANVATHEFGHTYGMDHVSARFNTMYPYVYTGETLKRSLASGDKQGILTLY